MGKTKQMKEKKFDRSVEISAPILDPEVIKAIHTPPKDKKRDIRHGGFKALLSDLNSQDSTDELTPITENHLPSYIGISCAVSGYSNYSSYIKKPSDEITDTKTSRYNQRNHHPIKSSFTPNRSHANSPIATKHDQQHINHVTIDKSTISSPDQERKELTEKLTASREAERRRSPSPLPPLEDDRHHGAYVGARYFPMPEPSKLVHKHIPLLGIDDDQDPDEFVAEDDNKVEKKIACLYGDEFVEGWKESLSHKSKKELEHNEDDDEKKMNHKDLVTLKPTPPKAQEPEESKITVDIPTPNVKVLAGVEKQFLNKLLTDENPPMPKSPSPQPMSPVSPKMNSSTANSTGLSPHKIVKRDGVVYTESLDDDSPAASPVPQDLHSSPAASPVPEPKPTSPIHESQPASPSPIPEPEPISPIHEPKPTSPVRELEPASPSPVPEPAPASPVHEPAPASPVHEQEPASLIHELESTSPVHEPELISLVQEPESASPESQPASPLPEPIIFEQQSPVKEVSPIRTPDSVDEPVEELVRLTPERVVTSPPVMESPVKELLQESIGSEVESIKDGRYFLNILEQEQSFILKQVELAETRLQANEAQMDEETIGKIRSAIGKANLLINKKCNQFRELCEKSLVNDANEQYAVLNDDLAGFWDMISIQLADVRKSFENL